MHDHDSYGFMRCNPFPPPPDRRSDAEKLAEAKHILRQHAYDKHKERLAEAAAAYQADLDEIERVVA